MPAGTDGTDGHRPVCRVYGLAQTLHARSRTNDGLGFIGSNMIKYKLWWDRLGIAMSVVCVVHCLMLPVAIAALPLVAAQWLQASTFHSAMALALVPVALLAAVPGLRMHGRLSVGLAMAAGLSLLSTAAFAGERWLSHEVAIGLTVAGGTILVTAHAVNLVLCRTCPACAAPEHEAEHR
jgi:hypothetical protein